MRLTSPLDNNLCELGVKTVPDGVILIAGGKITAVGEAAK